VLIISNKETGDDYSASLTMESELGGRLVYLIANQSVIASFRPLLELGGSQAASYGPEQLLTPQSGVIDKISGAKFRSAITGTPGRIIAQLSEPGDVLPAAGTPFTQSLAASGSVSAAIPSLLGVRAAFALTFGVADANVPGAGFSFDILGNAASIELTWTFDFVVTAIGFGAAVGSCNLDGGNVGVQAIYQDNGQANQRITVTQTIVVPVAAGPHSLQLSGFKTLAGGAVSCNAVQTGLSALILDK